MLDAEGEVVDGVSLGAIRGQTMLRRYPDMTLMRRSDRRAVRLQRQGRLGTYPSVEVQKGGEIASAHALKDENQLFPTYRDRGP